jgi:hypothetical protein
MNVGGVECIERELAGRVEARGSRALAVAGVAELLKELLFAGRINSRPNGRCLLRRRQDSDKNAAGKDGPRQQQ